MDEMGLELPPTHVDIADIRRKFHVAKEAAKEEENRAAKSRGKSTTKPV
jgi:hypothetical protein